ncbi:MAG: twin-arginine translocase TatA/TatE family subunit [Deltaproteobacteria bacterium]|nr:twin-arginine translocase TatA/TatE family subunit [Deltaproteobacteria bacterium]
MGHLLILAVILVLFGTRRLPELGAALGKSARAFRDALNGPDDGSGSKKKIKKG